jgi:hypothetical protein
MTKPLPRGQIGEAEAIQALETRLQKVLVPVPMRAGFALELRHKLQKENELELEMPRPGLTQTIFLAAAGLLSGVFLIALGVRGLIALVNSLGGLQQVKAGLARKDAAPAQPAV